MWAIVCCAGGGLGRPDRGPLGAAIGQLGSTAAYRFAPPREIAVFDYSNILFTAAFGYLLFAQVPDLASISGFVIILAAAFVMRR